MRNFFFKIVFVLLLYWLLFSAAVGVSKNFLITSREWWETRFKSSISVWGRQWMSLLLRKAHSRYVKVNGHEEAFKRVYWKLIARHYCVPLSIVFTSKGFLCNFDAIELILERKQCSFSLIHSAKGTDERWKCKSSRRWVKAQSMLAVIGWSSSSYSLFLRGNSIEEKRGKLKISTQHVAGREKTRHQFC